MLQIMVIGRPRSFELIEDADQPTLGGAFVIDEELFKDGVKSTRSWLVWVKKHHVPWTQKRIGTGGYKVIIFADDFKASLNFAGELRLMDIQGL